MVKAVLFDVGGTLLHMDRRFFIQTLNDNGVDADVAAFLRADAIGKREVGRILRSSDPGTDSSRWRAYARVLMHELRCEGEALDRVSAAVRARSDAANLWTHVEEDTVRTLEALKRLDYALGIVSNADGRVASFLAKAGLAGYFEEIVDSGLLGIEKPDARIFRHACERMNIDPAQTFYVGDVFEIDALGARGAGLTPIIVAQAAEPHWDCIVIQGLGQLPDIVMKRAARAAM